VTRPTQVQRSAARRTARTRGTPPLTRFQRAGLFGAPLAFAVPILLDIPGLEPAGQRMLAVFLLAVVLWVTEAVPLHATAAVIIGLEIALVSDQAVVDLPAGFDAPAFATFYSALAHPVLMLFLGGFFLADGAAKFSLDRNLAAVLLRPFARSSRMVMLGLMLITAVLSMFMSNTATTATMIAVVVPVVATLPSEDRTRTGLVLCIPVAASVGGLGTPVGTPPNAIALGALADAGVPITFVRWMVMAIPFMIVTLLAAWLLLDRLYLRSRATVALDLESRFERSRPAIVFYATFVGTILLWLSEPLHGVPSTVIGFVPVIVLLATRTFSADDLRNVRWDVLWLVAGGLALASGVAATGLDGWMVGLVDWAVLSPGVLLVVLALVAVTMSTLISNSATANLLLPLGLALAASDVIEVDPLVLGVIIAVGCSLAMALPVSTPPNAVAYSTGMVATRDLAVTGLIVGAIGIALFVLVGTRVWAALGLVAA
jgi:solute carrier family 13 (sodium-dependent dicarboxylate transporter), member 2/3/5